MKITSVVRRIGLRAFDAGVGETEYVTRIISQIVRTRYPGAYGKYSDFPEETKSICQNEFLKYYKFSEDENIDEAWKTFKRIADKNLQSHLNKCKDEAEKLYGMNIQDWKQHQRPSTYDWIKPNVWPDLCNYWCTEAFVKRSETNKRNRANSGESAFASTGSVNMLVHKQRFEKENNREPRWHDELFKLTHTNKKTGAFCSTKAENSQKKYETKMREKHGDEVNWPWIDESVWHTVTGLNAHGDNYGLGALGKTRSMIHTGGSSNSQSSLQTISSAPVPHSLTQEQINVISSQVLASVETKLDQFFKRANKKLKLMVSHALTNQGSSSSHHTSMPNIEDDVGNEGEDDDSDDSDDDV